MEEPTGTAREPSSPSKDPRRASGRPPRGLGLPPWHPDQVDRRLVELLLNDGRLSNAELARRAGLPESTCSTRVKALRERGVVIGIHADVDLARLGRPMEAMVAVRFSGHVRAEMDAFRAGVAQLPGVIAAYHVAGENDFLVHVCATSPHALRDFVLDRLTTQPGIVQAQTSLIFERIAGRRTLA